MYSVVVDEKHNALLPYMKHELFRRCLLGIYDEHIAAYLTHQYGLFAYETRQRVVVMEVDDTRWKLQQYKDREQQQLLEKLYYTFAQLCDQQGVELYCQLTEHRYVWLLKESCVPLPQHDMLQALSRQIEKQLNLTITIGVGSAVERIDELQFSYSHALQALSLKMFYGKRMIITYGQHQAVYASSPLSHNIEELLKQLYTAVASYQLVAIVDCIELLFEHAASLENETSIYQFVLYSISKIESYIYEDNENLYDMLQIDRNQWSIIMQFETVEDIHGWFRRTLFKLSECLYKRKSAQPSRLIQNIQRYIAERLDTPITLKAAAKQFAFTANYLGHLFKVEVGLSFTEYVTKLRMEKAKALLQDPTIKVYEVASAIGYKDLTYFSKQFKDYTGMTAGAYRRRG